MNYYLTSNFQAVWWKASRFVFSHRKKKNLPRQLPLVLILRFRVCPPVVELLCQARTGCFSSHVFSWAVVSASLLHWAIRQISNWRARNLKLQDLALHYRPQGPVALRNLPSGLQAQTGPAMGCNWDQYKREWCFFVLAWLGFGRGFADLRDCL